MSIRRLSEWVRCPHCFHGLREIDDTGRTFGCDSGHRFDLNRRGYLTLLPPKRPAFTPDSVAMLDARDTALSSGVYAPIRDALVRALPDHVASLVDLGCGTGYYAGSVARECSSAEVLLADLSPDAVRRAIRSVPGAHGVVLDIWAPLPLRDASCDVLLNVFAPRNLGEFARILAPGGTLLSVVPTPRHLGEFRKSGHAIEVPDGKAERLAVDAATLFAVERREQVEYRAELDGTTASRTPRHGPVGASSRCADAALPLCHGQRRRTRSGPKRLTGADPDLGGPALHRSECSRGLNPQRARLGSAPVLCWSLPVD